ncbi:MAG: hypothetical protein R3B74_01560 [Nitrospirales bacterium]|nr:hypothetical protein [Nitrospirales bacterium]
MVSVNFSGLDTVIEKAGGGYAQTTLDCGFVHAVGLRTSSILPKTFPAILQTSGRQLQKFPSHFIKTKN